MKSRRRRIVWASMTMIFVAVIAVGFILWHNGYRAYVIHTGSMVPTADPGDLVIDRPASAALEPGQIITFRHSSAPDLVTHRITDITASGGIHTKGDANPTPDTWTINPDMVVGAVGWHVPHLGYLVVYLRQPAGFGSIFVGLIGLVLLWGMFFPPTTSPNELPPRMPGSVRTHGDHRHRRTKPLPGPMDVSAVTVELPAPEINPLGCDVVTH